jgi:trimeric autotransporter adhesin
MDCADTRKGGMKKFKIRRLVIPLVVIILLTVCGMIAFVVLRGGESPTQVCLQTAKNFQPGFSSEPLFQNSRPYRGLNGEALALAQLPDGSLVVGGEFTEAGLIKPLHVARWDPAVPDWSALGNGLPEPVIELVSTPQGSIYAATYLKSDHTGTIPSQFKIYRWNNKTWELIFDPSPDDAIFFGSIEAMLWDGMDGFYLGGKFSAVGGLKTNGIIHWDGNAWSSLQGSFPLPGTFTTLALAKGPDGWLYAGGILNTNASDETNRVFGWNGETWTAMGGPLPGRVESLAVSTAGQLAGTIMKQDIPAPNQLGGWPSLGFNASTGQWVSIEGGLPALTGGFKVYPTHDLGFTPVVNSLPVQEITAWEGSLWQSRPNPYRPEYDRKHPTRLYVAAGNVYALGAFGQVGQVLADNIAVWNGQKWESLSGVGGLPPGGIPGTVNAMVVDSQGVVTVGGHFMTAGDVPVENIARWNGRVWQPMGNGASSEVLALAVGHDDHIYAGGNLGVAEWNPLSMRWTKLADGGEPGFATVTALTVAPDGVLYAAGRRAADEHMSIHAWNGKQWEDLPGLFDNRIDVIHVDQQGRLYVGGSFQGTSDTALNGLARWDAKSGKWIDLGAGLEFSSQSPVPSIHQLFDAPNGDLYVGGNFTHLNGRPICYVARLNISSGAPNWEPLGGGLPWFGRITPGRDGRLYAITIMAREKDAWDYQLVFLDPGREKWQPLGSMLGDDIGYDRINALAADSKGLLYMAGEFFVIEGRPARSFTVLQLPEN